MAEQRDWRVTWLPDGRRVEFVDALIVEQFATAMICDVTMLIDGTDISTRRIAIPVAAADLAGGEQE